LGKKSNKETKAGCSTHNNALFGHCTMMKTSLPSYRSILSVLNTREMTKRLPLAPYPPQPPTLLPNTFLVLIQQSKYKDQSETHARPSNVAPLTSKVELSMDKRTLQKDSCIQMPHSSKDLPRWRSEEGGLDLIESLKATTSTKVLAQGTPGRRAKVVDEWLRAKAIRKRLYAD
jgi:hypothetical protein